MGFWKNLLGQKIDDTVEGVTMAVYSWDPEAATDAELETAIQGLEVDVELRNEFKAVLDRELRELVEAKDAQAAAVALLTELQADYEAATGKKKQEFLEQAQTVAAALEDLDAAVATEEADIPPAQTRYDEMHQIVEQNQEMVNAAYKARDRAIADLKSAQRSKAQAKEDRKRQDRLDKAKSTGGGSPALSRLQAAASTARSDAQKDREMVRRVKEAKGGAPSGIEKIAAQRAGAEATAKAQNPFARVGKKKAA